MNTVVKTTRPFRYDLNQIPYNYTVEVRNRFKRYLLDRKPEELWTEVPKTVYKKMIKNIPRKKKCKMAKWSSEEALQIAEKRRDLKASEKGEIYPTQCSILENTKERAT